MPTQLELWKIDGEQLRSIPQKKLDLESRIENWLRKDITLISDDLLVVGQQVETAYGGFIDLLAIDSEGNLIILELKRDKTPRDIIAQCLDYASWVNDLNHESIQEIANTYLDGTSLEQAFLNKFHTGLPDVVNERHRIYIVASGLDSATERIVKYLSESHNVDVNVVTFAYFKTGDAELLGRSLLLDETAVQTRARTQSKRPPPRSWEELRQLADQKGAGPLYGEALSKLRTLFDGINRTRSNIAFVGRMGDNNAKNVIVGIYPGESSAEKGLAMMLYVARLCEYFDIPEEQISMLLDQNAYTASTYDPSSTWYFDSERLSRFIELLHDARQRVESGRSLVAD